MWEKKKKTLKLKDSLQLSAANPLGKMMDYVQEDVEAMQKELLTWKTENKTHLKTIVQVGWMGVGGCVELYVVWL